MTGAKRRPRFVACGCNPSFSSCAFSIRKFGLGACESTIYQLCQLVMDSFAQAWKQIKGFEKKQQQQEKSDSIPNGHRLDI